jgi:hypothetical protein
MKGTKILIVVACLLLAVIGWISFLGGILSNLGQYDKLIAAGDGYYEKGLYQRAAEQYTAALEYNDSEKTWDKIVLAYGSRYEEGGSQSEYAQALADAISACPKNLTYVEKIVDLYAADEEYETAYNWILKGQKNGVTSEKLDAQKLEFRYMYDLKSREYETFTPASNGWYTLVRKGLWGYLPQDLSTNYDYNKLYISPFGDSNLRVETTEKDSRLIGSGGFVYGIFDFVVAEAGVYSEGLIPVKASDGKWYYYNSLAEQKFGGYDRASTFQDGTAAVKADGKWGFINSNGEYISADRFDDICLDGTGRFLSKGKVMVAAVDGAYSLYNQKMERITQASWTNARFCSGEEWIAVEANGKWGFVDAKGDMKIQAEYDDARSFSNGLAAVCKGGKWGFINTRNYLAIEYQFLAADDFNSSGYCLVLVENEDGQAWQFLKLELGV